MNLNESKYTDLGFKDRDDYLHALANDYDVDYEVVVEVAESLGQEEDFDQLPLILNDYTMYELNNIEDEGPDYRYLINSYDTNYFNELDVAFETNDLDEAEQHILNKIKDGKYVVLQDTNPTSGYVKFYNPQAYNDGIINIEDAEDKTFDESLIPYEKEELSPRAFLNKLDRESFDNNSKYCDLCGCYEIIEEKLTAQKVKEVRDYLMQNQTKKPEEIEAYLQGVLESYEPQKEYYKEIATKRVHDWDDFDTDYTMYYNPMEDNYIFIFGDKELCTPYNTDYDWECDNEEEAFAWFNDYEGFDERNESLNETNLLFDEYEVDDNYYGKNKESEYHRLSRIYPNKEEFRDKEKESTKYWDLLDRLADSNIDYDIYNNRKDNGCTIFYENFEDMGTDTDPDGGYLDESLDD